MLIYRVSSVFQIVPVHKPAIMKPVPTGRASYAQTAKSQAPSYTNTSEARLPMLPRLVIHAPRGGDTSESELSFSTPNTSSSDSSFSMAPTSTRNASLADDSAFADDWDGAWADDQ